jgi:hypothetical protein
MSRLFGRGTRTTPADPAAGGVGATPGTLATDRKARGGRFAEGFSLMVWLRLHGVDIITMALMGALGLGIYMARR